MMTNDLHVTHDLPAYALGMLSAEERQRIDSHLMRCPTCQGEASALAEIAALLPLAAQDRRPPDHLRARVLKSIPGDAQKNRGRGESYRWQRAPYIWAVAAVVVILVLAFSTFTLYTRLRATIPAMPGLQTIALAGTDAAPDAAGLLVSDAEGQQGVLVVNGLPALDTSHQYQLWLIHDGERDNGGTFDVVANGYGYLEIEFHRPLTDYAGFGITIEPEGGSPGPTGQRVLVATR